MLELRVRLPSTVEIVQPSSRLVLVSFAPTLIIGSMVKTIPGLMSGPLPFAP